MRFCVGIVTYNPSLERLSENIESILSESGIGVLFIVDNGSSNIDGIRWTVSGNSRVHLIENGENRGIADALNTLCCKSVESGYDWLLTMDQDSVISKDYLRHYDNLARTHHEAGIICCRVEDRNFGRMYNAPESGWDVVERCITSGSMMNLSVWQKVGGFDVSLFIDGVDFDYCMTLSENGYPIVRTGDAYILHEVGHGRHVRLFGRNALVMNHGELRLYYIARNYLYIGKKHGQKGKWRREVLKRMLIVLLYEKMKIQKLKAMMRGVCHFRSGNMGRAC